MLLFLLLGVSGILTLMCALCGAYQLVGHDRVNLDQGNTVAASDSAVPQTTQKSMSLEGGASGGRVDLEDASLASDERLTASNQQGFLKRALDLSASLALLVFTFPVLVLTAILIKLESKGPVFYKQTRIGLNGKPFKIYKFRSMTVNAEKDGAVWASQNDSRVTRVGRVIRLIRVDEIPQVLNIFLGQMSFVGPRPERPEFTQLLSAEMPLYDLRHNVKPGLTGWAQINYHYGGSVKDAAVKLEYDLYYIRKYSVFFDVWIMLKTVRVALFGLGSR